MAGFSDNSIAMGLRDIIRRIVGEEIAREAPGPKYGRVYSYNRFNGTCKVLLIGDEDPITCRMTYSIQPLYASAVDGDIVRVEGKPGGYWITACVSDAVFNIGSKFFNPQFYGGGFFHVPYRTFFCITAGLPAVGNAWHIGTIDTSEAFGSDNTGTVEFVIVHGFFTTQSKSYRVSVKQGLGLNVWKKVAPYSTTGPFNGNDFEAEIKVGTDNFELRIRRTAEWVGFTPGGYMVNFDIQIPNAKHIPVVGTAETSDPPPTSVYAANSSNLTEDKGPFVAPLWDLPRRMQNVLRGGGVVVWSGTHLKWGSRFIVMGAGQHWFSEDGYFDITTPANTTSIPVFGKSGVTSVAATAAGVPLASWDSLYYDPPLGTIKTSSDTNFRIVNYTAGFEVPAHWIFIAGVNGDTANSTLQLGTGEAIDYKHALPSLPTNWADYGGAYDTSGYRKRGQEVWLEGLIKNNTGSTSANPLLICTLPAGYRPPGDKIFACDSVVGHTRIDVESDGIVRLRTAITTAGHVSLENIRYIAAL